MRPTMTPGLTAKQLTDKVKGLTAGNFWYWVRYKCRLEPIGERRIKHMIADVFSEDAVEIVKAKMKGAKQ
jgi:hypothetical protein